MKVYINNFNIEILSTLLKKLSDKYINSEIFIQIYSIDGIYKIDESSIFKLNCIDNDIIVYNNFYNDFTLIVDPSYYTIEKVYTINSEHMSTNMKKCFFGLNKDSRIKLVIEGEIIEKACNSYGINPNDIYFEMSNDIDINDALVKKEIIVFLSLLN